MNKRVAIKSWLGKTITAIDDAGLAEAVQLLREIAEMAIDPLDAESATNALHALGEEP